MKSADAKAPKFDSKWWKQNKAKEADAKGQFEKALTDYEKARSGVIKGDFVPVAKALDAVVKEAKTQKADPKLGVMQKDTKESFASYEKLAGAALTRLTGLLKDPDYVACMNKDDAAGLQDMVKRQSKTLHQFLVRDHSAEGYEFAVQVFRKVWNQKVYDMYISPNGPKQVNFKGTTQKAFDDIAAQPTPSWDKAPWKVAFDEIMDGMQRDNYVRFRVQYLKQAQEAAKLP